MPIILVIIIPISFGYAIFRYQLMDVSVVVKTAIIYGSATITIAAVYFGIIYLISQSVGTAFGTDYKSAVAVITFVIFTLIFQSTKERFQDLLTKKFYPEQFTYQKVILKFSNDVMTIVGIENILESMHETFIKALKLNRFGILLRDNPNDNLILKKQFGIKENPLDTVNQKLTDFIREKLLIGGPIVIEQQHFQEIFPDNYQKLAGAEIYTIIPMIIKSKVIGLLLFGLKYSGSEFAGKDLELLCTAATQAGVSLENARLYEAETQKITLERDLAIAKKIQQGLLPKYLPSINDLDICGEMIPALQVGGDYFDIINVAPGKLFVIVSDVSGKGLSASLYMSKLQTIMRLNCVDGKSPKEILVEANKKIYESIERNWFITISLALIDTNTHKIKFCRAGHSELLVLNSKEPLLIKPKGIGLGLEEGKIFADTLEEIEIEYHPGQIYAFFSDGISEAMNEKNELFGLEALTKAITINKNHSASEIVKCVMQSIDMFRGNREQSDDITMVLVKAC
jgi:serine phosphatase RsbU (regulator of sigma subunit)